MKQISFIVVLWAAILVGLSGPAPLARSTPFLNGDDISDSAKGHVKEGFDSSPADGKAPAADEQPQPAATSSITIPLPTGSPVSVTYYRDGSGKFSLEPIGSQAGWALPLKGTSQYKMLWFQIKHVTTGKVHDMKLYLDKTDSFDCYYTFKDAPGNYTVVVFGAQSQTDLRFAGLCTFSLTADSSLGEDFPGYFLNSPVIAYVNASMGKKIGRGECWDLAQEVLDLLGADWVRTTQYGKPLNIEKDEIRPGDIIQFYSAKFTYKFDDGRQLWETLGSPDHTSIVYEVLGPKHYKLAHQNVGGKRYVVVSEIDFNHMTGGKFWIYRPVIGLIFK